MLYEVITIYHSKDLVNWELVGYGIHRPNQVELPEGLGDSRGVYAPTIRYYNGLFYIINTCVQCEGNFYITAENPSGPWSDPVWLRITSYNVCYTKLLRHYAKSGKCQ